jgi:hypothetical protein
MLSMARRCICKECGGDAGEHCCFVCGEAIHAHPLFPNCGIDVQRAFGYPEEEGKALCCDCFADPSPDGTYGDHRGGEVHHLLPGLC